MPIAGTMFEVVNELLFDSEVLGKERTSLFSVPLGQISPTSGRRKMFTDTNMYECGQLPVPQRFLVKGIRCVFLEPDGRCIPVHDAVYWESTLTLLINNKTYWQSRVAEVVDPVLLTTPEQWQKMTPEQKRTLFRRFSNQLVSDSNQLVSDSISPERILVPSFPDDKVVLKIGIPSIDGVLIQQQEFFQVYIEHGGKWPDRRILCALQGTMLRPVM